MAVKTRVREDFLVLEVKGVLYAASWFGVGWWVWSLERSDSHEYFVDHKLDSCTCPVEGTCKHLTAMRNGNVRRDAE